MQRHETELHSLRIAVAVVTFERLAVAQAYKREATFPWPILVDELRELYRTYGMERGGWWAIFGPASWWGYLKLLLRGRRLRRPTGDLSQLGGDVLIDPGRIVRLHHVGRSPVDRPRVESLMEIVRGRAANEENRRAE